MKKIIIEVGFYALLIILFCSAGNSAEQASNFESALRYSSFAVIMAGLASRFKVHSFFDGILFITDIILSIIKALRGK